MVRCTLGHHHLCAGCDVQINASKPHQHHVWISRPNEVLCADCSAAVIKAARVVLEALAAIYGAAGAQEFESLIDANAVHVMVQLPIDASLN